MATSNYKELIEIQDILDRLPQVQAQQLLIDLFTQQPHFHKDRQPLLIREEVPGATEIFGGNSPDAKPEESMIILIPETDIMAISNFLNQLGFPLEKLVWLTNILTNINEQRQFVSKPETDGDSGLDAVKTSDFVNNPPDITAHKEVHETYKHTSGQTWCVECQKYIN